MPKALKNGRDRRHKVFHRRMLTALLISVIEFCQSCGGSVCRKLAEDGSDQVFKLTSVCEVEVRQARRWVSFAQCTNIFDGCRTADPFSPCHCGHQTCLPQDGLPTSRYLHQMNNCDQRLRAMSNVRIARSQRNDLSYAFHLRKLSPSRNQEPVSGSRFSQTVLWIKEMSRMALRVDEPSGSNSHRWILSRRSSMIMDIEVEATRHV